MPRPDDDLSAAAPQGQLTTSYGTVLLASPVANNSHPRALSREKIWRVEGSSNLASKPDFVIALERRLDKELRTLQASGVPTPEDRLKIFQQTAAQIAPSLYGLPCADVGGETLPGPF
jgi:hypothetical protein